MSYCGVIGVGSSARISLIIVPWFCIISRDAALKSQNPSQVHTRQVRVHEREREKQRKNEKNSDYVCLLQIKWKKIKIPATSNVVEIFTFVNNIFIFKKIKIKLTNNGRLLHNTYTVDYYHYIFYMIYNNNNNDCL